MAENIPQAFTYDLNAVSAELHVRPEILQKLLVSFSQTLAGKIAQLDVLVPAHDVEKIRAIMHEVKGTSGNLRLTRVYQSADTMHIAVKAGEPQERIMEYFATFKKESQLYIDQMKSA